MKITVGLSTKSIDKAIKQVEWYRKHFVRLIPKMMSRFADRVAELANEKIGIYDDQYDSEIIEGIKGGWVKEESEGGLLVTLSNTYNKAVYIEFGVGQVGAEQSHENAGKAGYQYDKNSHGDKGWGFYIGDEPLDLQRGYYYDFYKYNQNKFWIWTKGSPSTMFLYHAAMDFVDKEEFVPIIEEFLSGVKWI